MVQGMIVDYRVRLGTTLRQTLSAHLFRGGVGVSAIPRLSCSRESLTGGCRPRGSVADRPNPCANLSCLGAEQSRVALVTYDGVAEKWFRSRLFLAFADRISLQDTVIFLIAEGRSGTELSALFAQHRRRRHEETRTAMSYFCRDGTVS